LPSINVLAKDASVQNFISVRLGQNPVNKKSAGACTEKSVGPTPFLSLF